MSFVLFSMTVFLSVSPDAVWTIGFEIREVLSETSVLSVLFFSFTGFALALRESVKMDFILLLFSVSILLTGSLLLLPGRSITTAGGLAVLVFPLIVVSGAFAVIRLLSGGFAFVNCLTSTPLGVVGFRKTLRLWVACRIGCDAAGCVTDSVGTGFGDDVVIFV